MPNAVRGQRSRCNRWIWIFNNNTAFRHNIDRFFGYRPTDYFIGSAIEKIYSNVSSDIHSFDKSKGVKISTTDYSPDEQHVLKSICATIPCNISVE
jgi:hypothetical protein